MKVNPKRLPLPADPLELYMREARSHRLLNPEEEKALLSKLVAARDHWLSSFLETEPALRAIWGDLEACERGEMSALSLIPGPPKPSDESSGPTYFARRLHRIFSRQIAIQPRRPFRGKKVAQRLVRCVLFVGFRPAPFERYRLATLETANNKTAARIRRARNKFLDTRAPLIEKNLRLVMKLAHNFVPGPLPYAELIQEGNLGLIRSTESFSPRFGVRFSTYAYLWIRQSILRALENKSRTIRLPVSLTQALRKLDKEQATAGNSAPETGRKTLSRALSNPTVSRPLLSLAHNLDDDTELSQVIADRKSPAPDRAPQTQDSDLFVRLSLAELPDRQRLIIRLRFGLDGAREHTLTEIGNLLGISAERIRQLQKQAFDNLRAGPAGGRLYELSLD